MTDPAHYRVGYEINPWMTPRLWGADPLGHACAARRAWDELKRALETAGARVRVIAGARGQPDMVFAANAAVVLDRRALPARFRHPERSGEEVAYLSAFEALRCAGVLDEVAQIDDVVQEGAGDAIWDRRRGLFWTGFGPRSDRAAAEVISGWFGRPAVALELADPRYYHLDTCLLPLPGGEVVHYPPAFTAAGLRRLRSEVPGDLLIEASAADAVAFAVNAVALGERVIMARGAPGLCQRLAGRGYRVTQLDLAPFLMAGGAAFCMTLRLDLTSAPTRFAALAMSDQRSCP